MRSWTFLLWFELPSDLDSGGGPPFLSGAERHILLERTIGRDDRWELKRTRIANPAGRGERQSLLLFLATEAETSSGAEAPLRAGIGELVTRHVPNAQLTWVLDITDQWTDDVQPSTPT